MRTANASTMPARSVFVWLFDLGNTRLKLTRVASTGLGPVTALAHAEPDFDEELRRVLETGTGGDTAWLASVAGVDVRQRVEAVLQARGLRVVRAQTRRACAGVRIAYVDPERLGVDRFLGLLAAHRLGGDWLVVSFGSALTLDLIDVDGRHRGGLIGLSASQQVVALRARFPALDCGVGDPAQRWAGDTADAVAAGARRQALGLVLAAFDDARTELGRTPALLLGGGDAPLFAAELARRLAITVDVREALVLEGLSIYADAMG